MRNSFWCLLIMISMSCGGNKNEREVIHVKDVSEIDTTNTALIIDEDGTILYKGSGFDHNQSINQFVSNSLNDSVFYELQEDSLGFKKKLRVFKYDYRTESYLVDINNDTINQGDMFVSYFGLYDDKAKIVINHNGRDSIVTFLHIEQLGGQYRYSLKADSVGVKTFDGRVAIGGEVHPFEYKYVVVAKDSIE